MVKAMENERNRMAFGWGRGVNRCCPFNRFVRSPQVIRWLSALLDVGNADMKAIVEEPVSDDQPREIISEYEGVACHMDGAAWRANKDRNQMPEAMPRR